MRWRTMTELTLMVLAMAMLTAFVYSGGPAPALAVSDIGNPNVSRLWVEGTDDKMNCTVFYVRDLIENTISEGFSWVLSAGHCTSGRLIKRNADVWIIGAVNWQVSYTSGSHGLRIIDYAIGSVPDDEWIRPAKTNRGFWTAEAMPDSGRAYIHGFPEGVERVTAGYILPKDVPIKPDVFRGPSRVMAVKKGEVAGGSSGGPVIDDQGRVIGIVWGIVGEPEKLLVATVPPDVMLVIVTPIEIVREAFKGLRAK